MKIGVLSDTHNLFDPRIPELFAGVDHILHAGDVGQPHILHQLEQIAPVTAVLGNNDSLLPLRPIELLELGTRKFLLLHIANPHAPSPSLQRLLAQHAPAVLVFGHSHKAFAEVVGTTLFLNPGSAGPARFGGARTLALLHCDPAGLRPEFLSLGR